MQRLNKMGWCAGPTAPWASPLHTVRKSDQCCQVLPKFSGLPNEKILPITEKIRPVTEMIEKASSNHLLAYCNYLKGNFYQVASYKNPNVVHTFWCLMSFFSFLLSNIYKNKFPAPFWPLFKKFGNKIFLANHFSFLPLLSFWAGNSATRQHCYSPLSHRRHNPSGAIAF